MIQLRKYLMKVIVTLFIYMMLLVYDAFNFKEFERAYDKACNDALRSIEGIVL